MLDHATTQESFCYCMVMHHVLNSETLLCFILQRIMMAEQASQYLKADSPETTVPYQN